jgi:hypothetical protein
MTPAQDDENMRAGFGAALKLTEEAVTMTIEERAREYLRQCAPQHLRAMAELIMQNQHLLMDAVRRYGNSNTNDEIIAAVRQAIAESIERTAP